MDATAFLIAEHSRFRSAVTALERRGVPDPGAAFAAFATDLVIHAAIEEDLLYPRLERMTSLRSRIKHAYHEHHLIDVQLDEITAVPSVAGIWADKLHVLRETLLHHLDEEEKDVFPEMGRILPSVELERLGQALADLHQEYRHRYDESPPKSAQREAERRLVG